MARRCDLTNKDAQSGNNVSHAQNKTRRTFKVNIQNVTLVSDVLVQNFSVRIAVSTLRSIEHNGGLDNYLTNNADSKLSDYAKKLKRKIKKATAAKEQATDSKKVTEQKAA